MTHRMGIVWALGIGGCAGDKDTTPIDPIPTETGTEQTGDTGEPRPGPDLVVTAGAVYTVAPEYHVDIVDVRESWDMLLTWTDLGVDGWGEVVNPSELGTVALYEVLAAPEEVESALESGALAYDVVSLWTADVQGISFASMTDLSSGATPFDPVPFLVENPDKSWLLAVGVQGEERFDLRAAVTLSPDDASGETQVAITDSSSSFTYSAALDGAPLVTASGWELYTVDWEALGTDALGKPYDDELGDELFVARFDGVSAADLGATLLTWETTASGWYTMDVARETDARLDLAKDADGNVFAGFTAGATWVVGVRCTTCDNPFPLWVVTVDVSS
ncbi:MAG: hypothetical protein ABMA64_08935 [Myxococcota bacterium]